MTRTLVHRGLLWLGLVLSTGIMVLAPNWAWAQADEEDGGDPTTRTSFQDERRRSLADRIPSVTSRLYEKGGRVEIQPAVGLALNDPFFNHILFGANVGYHINESLSLGVTGEYFLNVDSPVRVSGGGNPARPDYNRPQYGAQLNFSFAPIYGKLSLIAEEVLYFDTYITGAVGVLGSSRSGIHVSGALALGQRYFINRWMAIRIELRNTMFKFARNPDVNTNKDFQSLLTATVGVSFFLPTEPRGGGKQPGPS